MSRILVYMLNYLYCSIYAFRRHRLDIRELIILFASDHANINFRDKPIENLKNCMMQKTNQKKITFISLTV